MESLKSPTMHIMDTKAICSTLPCSRNEDDEVLKKLENELLYGATDGDEDGDEDDAQSDDSLRLRLSDDEVEADDIGTPSSINIQPDESEKTEESLATEHASNRDMNAIGLDNIQHKINNDTASIVTDNNSLESIGPKISSDKFISPVNAFDKSSFTLNIPNEPKENGIIDNDMSTTISEISTSNNSEEETEKMVDKSDIQPLNVPNHIETEVADIFNKVITMNNSYQSSNSNNSSNQQIQHIQSLASEAIVIGPAGELLKDEAITNVEEPKINGEKIKVSIDNKLVILNTKGMEEVVEKVSSNDTIVSKETECLNSEDQSVTDNNKERNSNKQNKEIDSNHFVSILDTAKITCTEKSTQELVITDPVLTDKIEEEPLLTSETHLSTEKSSNLDLTIKHENNSDTLKIESEKLNNIVNSGVSELIEENTLMLPIEILDDDESVDNEDDKLEVTVISSIDTSPKIKRRRRKRKMNSALDVETSGQEKENVRQKRVMAQKAEEMIRKLKSQNSDFQTSESDSENSNYSPSVTNHNKSNSRTIQPSSPTLLKRNCPDELVEGIVVKKPKKESESISSKSNDTVKLTNTNKNLEQVRKFFWRDGKKPLSKFTQEELEELLIQKVIETITMRDEIGKLREQAKISERNQEATRLKCQQLTKQIKDFEMVLNRFSADRRGNDKNVPPIKINRSVGLQVNFVTDHGIQNLRQLQHNIKSTAAVPNGGNSVIKQLTPESLNNNPIGRKGIKVRSPRRTGDVSSLPTTASVTSQIQSSTTTTISPAALVVTKVTENRNINSSNQVITQQGTITVNGSVTPVTRQTKILNTRSNNNNSENLIDLTGEDEKSKNIMNPPPLAAITTTSSTVTLAKVSPRYQRVIQPTPPNVTISQPSFKLVGSVDKPTPAAIVNNMNAPRLAIVMHGITGQHQLLIPSNTTPIRPAVTVNNRAAFPAITYTGVQTIPNGSVRVVPITTTAPAQKHKHPAPLPSVTTYPVNAALKLPPPAPSLKISKVANGIVLSWNMRTSDEYAEIASYQLYAYQEITGLAPSTALWKKVGDVRALPLPMACTLTQFSEGNNYYFAVRAVDTHSRFGQYSQPGNISL